MSALLKDYDPKVLARAARARARSIDRQVAISGACCCAWPVVQYRNQHGHDGGCPAVDVWLRFRDEDKAAREDAGL